MAENLKNIEVTKDQKDVAENTANPSADLPKKNAVAAEPNHLSNSAEDLGAAVVKPTDSNPDASKTVKQVSGQPAQKSQGAADAMPTLKKEGAKETTDADDKETVKEGEMPKAALDALKKSQDKKEDLDAKELQTKKTDGYKSKNESWRQAWEEATMHKMPDGTMMKGAKHKEETKDEANDVDNGDEKKPVANKDAKKLADSGSKLTKVETEPEADFRN